MPPRNETGAAELGLTMIAGVIAATVAAMLGAGWWALLAWPASFALYVGSVLVRSIKGGQP